MQTQQLERVVRRLIPWQRIGPNIREGHLESLSVTTTDIGSGKSVVFVQNAAGGTYPQWSKDPFVRTQSVTMAAEHALASAALPILLPAICIGERFFCDGGLHQNTPLSPALGLGADKVLVIGLRRKPPAGQRGAGGVDAVSGRGVPGRQNPGCLPPRPHDYDLNRLRRFNALIEAGARPAARSTPSASTRPSGKMRGAPYRIVGEYMIRPSGDLGEIAGHVARTGRFKGSGGGAGIQLLRRLATARGADEADLISYILFDGLYAAEVAQMGYEDARSHHDNLAKSSATPSSGGGPPALLDQAELGALATASDDRRLGERGGRGVGRDRVEAGGAREREHHVLPLDPDPASSHATSPSGAASDSIV